MIKFFVAGQPATAGSKRGIPIYRGKKGEPRVFTGHVAVVDDAEARGKPWRVAIQTSALAAATMCSIPPIPWRCAIRLVVTFVVPRPKAHFDRLGALRARDAGALPAKRPDLSKYLRIAEDSLKHVLWADDAQVTTTIAKKRYCSPGHVTRGRVGAWFTITFDEEDAQSVVPAKQANGGPQEPRTATQAGNSTRGSNRTLEPATGL